MRKTIVLEALVIILAFVIAGCNSSSGGKTVFTAVTDITGIPSGWVKNQPLTLTGTVVPPNATNKKIIWMIKDEGTTGASVTGSALTATAAGTVTVTAIIANGTEDGINFTKDFEINITDSFNAVTSISGVPASGTTGAPVILAGMVNPIDATNKTIIWTVKSAGTTGAKITGNSLTASKAGTVTVTARITSGAAIGTDYTHDFEITITSAGSGLWNNSAIGGTLAISNAQLYDYDGDAETIISFVQNGSLELHSRSYELFNTGEIYWEEEGDVIVTEVINNKLSFSIGSVPTSKLSYVYDNLTAIPSNVKGVIVTSLDYDDMEYWEDSCSFRLINKNNFSEEIAFVYVDRDAVINGVDWLYWDLSLKEGWNLVKFDYDREKVTSFVPDDNYIWMTGGLSNIGEKLMGFFIDQPTCTISGNLNVLVDGAFPEGGIELISYSNNNLPDFISDGPNPIAWEIEAKPLLGIYGREEYINFSVNAYLDAEKKSFLKNFRLQVQVTNPGNFILCDNPAHYYYDDLSGTDVHQDYMGYGVIVAYKLEGLEFEHLEIKTKTVPVSVSGLSGNAVIYFDDYNSSIRYGMEINGNGTYNLKIPVEAGNWLWFRIELSSGQQFITAGRMDTRLPVALNLSEMIKFITTGKS